METIAAPPPNTGDGLTENEAKALSDKPQNSKGLLPTMMAQAQSGTLVSDASTLLAVLESATGEIDDREMLLERIVTLLQGLPSDSSLQQTITETLLKMLWNDLSHPPSSFLSSSKSVNPKDKGELSRSSRFFLTFVLSVDFSRLHSRIRQSSQGGRQRK